MKIINLLLRIYYLKFFRIIFKYIYLITGKKPWSLGYLSYRNEVIEKNIKSNFLKYISENKLPKKYGFGLDERIIEYPWLLSSLPKKAKYILDAGSIFNYKFILESKQLTGKNILISNLNHERENHNDMSISYLYGLYGDLRNIIIKDGIFDAVVCGSVLEHVGMDNATIYNNNNIFKENKIDDYLSAVKEFKRVLKINGICLITVPFGKSDDYGWFQVFNTEMINKIIRLFGIKNSTVALFKYSDKGWKISNIEECRNARYFDVHKRKGTSLNRQAAAGAMACIKMIKR